MWLGVTNPRRHYTRRKQPIDQWSTIDDRIVLRKGRVYRLNSVSTTMTDDSPLGRAYITGTHLSFTLFEQVLIPLHISIAASIESETGIPLEKTDCGSKSTQKPKPSKCHESYLYTASERDDFVCYHMCGVFVSAWVVLLYVVACVICVVCGFCWPSFDCGQHRTFMIGRNVRLWIYRADQTSYLIGCILDASISGQVDIEEKYTEHVEHIFWQKLKHLNTKEKH